MSSRNLFSAVALAMLAALAACGGGEASDDNAGGSQASSIGGIGGTGTGTQSVGGIGGTGTGTQSVGGIGGTGTGTQSVGGIGGTGTGTQSVGGIGGTGATTQGVGAVRACGLQSVNVTIAGVRVNANGAADLGSAGWVDVALPAPVRVDLLALAAGGALPVDLTTLPDGTYRQMRLLLAADDAGAPLADSVVSASHVETALAVPGAAAGGLPMAVAITVAGGQVSASWRDLDVCKGVSASAGTYAIDSLASSASQVAAAY